LDDRSERLLAAVIAGQIDPNQLKDLSSSLLPLLFGRDLAAQTAAQSRLRSQYKKGYADLSQKISKPTADIWIDAILVLEKAADLGDKDEMQVFGITASEEELASGKLEAFLGFFDQAYRDHDYDVGRTKARGFINGIHLNGKVDLWFPHHPVNNPTATAEPWMQIRPINEALNGLELENVPENLREKLKGRLVEKADDLLAEMGISWVGRKAVNLFFIKPKLNKWIGL